MLLIGIYGILTNGNFLLQYYGFLFATNSAEELKLNMKRRLINLTIVFIALLLVSCEIYDNQKPYADNPDKINLEIIELQEKIDMINKEKQSQIDELKVILKEMEANRDQRNREALEYRNEINMLLKLLDSGELGANEIPVFKGFENTVNKQHINTIDQYLTRFRNERVNDPNNTAELEPILHFLTIEPTKPNYKEEDEHYYEVVFYESLIPDISYKKEPLLTRGPFDGFHWFLLQIKEIDNKWQVINFGRDS